jgi:hypothetical protein
MFEQAIFNSFEGPSGDCISEHPLAGGIVVDTQGGVEGFGWRREP